MNTEMDLPRHSRSWWTSDNAEDLMRVADHAMTILAAFLGLALGAPRYACTQGGSWVMLEAPQHQQSHSKSTSKRVPQNPTRLPHRTLSSSQFQQANKKFTLVSSPWYGRCLPLIAGPAGFACTVLRPRGGVPAPLTHCIAMEYGLL